MLKRKQLLLQLIQILEAHDHLEINLFPVTYMLVRQYLIMTILFIWNEQLHLKLLDRKALEEKREIKEIKEIKVIKVIKVKMVLLLTHLHFFVMK